MGIESAFSGEEEIMNALDQILLRDGNFEHAKSIVKVIFEDSYAVNEVLGIVAQPLVERFIEDEPTQNLILDIILEESFEYGKEVVTLLNITEHVYSFTTIGQIQNAIDNDDYFSIIDRLGTLNEVQYENLKSDIYALQVLNLGSRDLIEFIKDEASLEILSIPLGTDIVSIKQDLDKGLDLLFVAAKQIHTHQITKDNFEDVDLLSVIPFEVIADILRFDEVKDENSILLNTVVDFISDESIQLGSYGHITLPSELESKPYNDKVWVDEINYLLLGSLDILKEVSTADTDFNFSIKNINRINGLEDIPAKLVTSLNNEDKIDRAFHKLTSSLLLKYNAVEIGTKILESSENAFDFAVPINYYKSEDLSSDNLTELLKISINLFSRTILDETDNLASQIDKLDLARMIYTFNGLEEVMIERIGYQVTINNIFRSLATNTSIHKYVYDSINQLNIERLDIIDDGIFDLNSSIDATGKLRSSTLYQLLSFARNLEVPTNINHLSEKELIDYMDQRLSPELIDQLFDIHLVHEALSPPTKT